MGNKKTLAQKTITLKHPLSLFSFIFIIWATYRYFPEILPEWVEELILKPIFWLLPTAFFVKKIEKNNLSSLGFQKKNFFPSLYWGIGLGMVFALEGFLANILKYKGVNFGDFFPSYKEFFFSLFLSFVTAFSEETVFRGYILSRLFKIWKSEIWANIVSSFLFTFIHLPIAIFVLSYTPQVMVVYLFLIFVFSFAAGFVFLQTENIVSSILLHVFWSWPVILFR